MVTMSAQLLEQIGRVVCKQKDMKKLTFVDYKEIVRDDWSSLPAT